MIYDLLTLYIVGSVVFVATIKTQEQSLNNQVRIDNNCTVNKFRIPVSAKLIRTIYQFSCYSSDETEPVLPSIGSSQSYEYNELDLSHNVFDRVPYSQLCQFKYVYLLNISLNYISNLTGAFVSMKCLGSLTSLDFSSNLIVTPILASDFDDTVASRLQSINFESNRISYIQTSAFIKKDGTSRFPNLNYLNLAKNFIKKFDLLWPLTLPSPSLFVDLKLNPIEELINQMGISFKNPSFVHDMVGNRYLDATTNNLQYLDDTNLMQYGLQDAKDFRQFMNKISNYDFRQSNFIRTFICFCPSSGQYTVTWFKNVSNSLDLMCPIYQLYCSNYQEPVYVLNFPCEITKETSKIPMPSRTENTKNLENLLGINTLLEEVKSSSLTTNQIIPQKTIATQTTTKKNENFLIRVLGSQFTASIIDPSISSTKSQIQTKSNDYVYLFLLTIPLVLIIIVSITCLCGRRLQIFIHNSYSVLMCPCFRPNDNSFENAKTYDLTICFSEYDDLWLNEQFMPQLSQFDLGYKVHKLSLYHRLNFHLSETTKRVLQSSKRILLVFSEKFYNDEWNNRLFHEFIKNIYENDDSCILIVLNIGNINESKMLTILNEFNLGKQNQSLLAKLKSNLIYTFGLTGAEYLNWKDKNFWKQFTYIMPFRKSSQIKKLTHSSKEKRVMPKYINQTFEINTTSNVLRSGSNSPVSRLNSMRNSKKRSRRVVSNDTRILDFNTPRISVETGGQTDTDNSLKKSAPASVRQVIVPIPNEMRTQLGSAPKSSKPKIFDFVNNESIKTLNECESSSDKLQNKSKIFLTYNSKSIEPVLVQQQQQQQQKTDRLFMKSEISPSGNAGLLLTGPSNLFERQPSSKRTRLHSEMTSSDITNTAPNNATNVTNANKLSHSSLGTINLSSFNSKQSVSSNHRSRRRRLSRSDSISLNGDSSR